MDDKHFIKWLADQYIELAKANREFADKTVDLYLENQELKDKLKKKEQKNESN